MEYSVNASKSEQIARRDFQSIQHRKPEKKVTGLNSIVYDEKYFCLLKYNQMCVSHLTFKLHSHPGPAYKVHENSRSI